MPVEDIRLDSTRRRFKVEDGNTDTVNFGFLIRGLVRGSTSSSCTSRSGFRKLCRQQRYLEHKLYVNR